jgi:hypothetical protein
VTPSDVRNGKMKEKMKEEKREVEKKVKIKRDIYKLIRCKLSYSSIYSTNQIT